MNKYKIKTHELQWIWGFYEIEADSEEEAIEKVYLGEGEVDWDLDCVDQIDIDHIEELDD